MKLEDFKVGKVYRYQSSTDYFVYELLYIKGPQVSVRFIDYGTRDRSRPFLMINKPENHILEHNFNINKQFNAFLNS